MPVYDLSNPDDAKRLHDELIPIRTPREARLRLALAKGSKAERQAFLMEVRANFGEQAADELIEDLWAMVETDGSHNS